MSRRTVSIIRAFAVAALIAVTAGNIQASDSREGRFDKTLTVSGRVSLDVETGSGNITIRRGAAGSVAIHGNIRANNSWRDSDADVESRIRAIEQHPPIEQDGNTIRIGHGTDRELMRNISVSYEITLPEDSTARSQTGSGSINVTGIRGPLELSTGSGNISAEDVNAEVTASTGSGSIGLRNVRAAVRTNTGSGNITGSGISGGVNASTGSGSIRFEQNSAGDIEARTGSGNIEISGVKGSLRARTGSGSIEARGEQTGDWHLHSGSGSVTVRLPANAAFELDARTSSGSIHTEHSVTVQGTIGRHEVRGKVGGGGPMLEVSTSSGSIRIE